MQQVSWLLSLGPQCSALSEVVCWESTRTVVRHTRCFCVYVVPPCEYCCKLVFAFFLGGGANFATIKNFFQKSKCMHHPHTKGCTRFWQCWIIQQHFAKSVNFRNPAMKIRQKMHENIKKVARIWTSSGYLSEILSITELHTHLKQSRAHTTCREHPIRTKTRQSECTSEGIPVNRCTYSHLYR